MEDTPKEASAKRKKRGIVAAIVATVAVVAGIGLFVWHEQPSFCSTICHTPMDGYLDTYDAQAGEPAVDKWGNEVADAQGMLAANHGTEEVGATCMSCHVPTMSEQISEGMAWIAGDYTLVENETRTGGGALPERSIADLTEARGVAADQFCLNEDCHDVTRDDLTEMTDPGVNELGLPLRNPHSWRHGEVACSDCHKAHRASVLTCTECHAEMELPEGWISAQELKQMEHTA